jgi:uncharacterized protein (TIGR00299 family) protein
LEPCNKEIFRDRLKKMRGLYIDCFAGISGDMFLGSLIDLGIPLEVLKSSWEKVGLRVQVEVEEVTRSGLRGKRIKADFRMERLSSGKMREMIEKSDLKPEIKEISLKSLRLLEEAEIKVHGRRGHTFHELGDPDTLFDLVGVATCLDYLQIHRVFCSPIPLARGKWVKTEHGFIPIPAPVTLEILKGAPISGSSLEIENVTPTGAALLKAIVNEFTEFPPMRIEAIGYGAGMIDTPQLPNLLRVVMGELMEGKGEEVWLLETDMDDLHPEILPHLEEALRGTGALDVVLIPNRMKKGRIGVTLRCLSEEKDKEKILDILFAESSTLGVRGWKVWRWKLHREEKEVNTSYGSVKVKIGFKGSKVVNLSPEYESCLKLAKERGVPLKEIYHEAISAGLKLLKEKER